MSITETKFGVLCIPTSLWWSVVMNDWNLDYFLSSLLLINLDPLKGRSSYKVKIVQLFAYQGGRARAATANRPFDTLEAQSNEAHSCDS